MVLGMGDLADVLGDTVAGDDRHLRTAHATKVMRKLERRGFAHPEPESLDGKKMWVIETGRLRKALEAQQPGEPVRKVAELADAFKKAVADGAVEEAKRTLLELKNEAAAHKDDQKVRAFMVGLIQEKLPLTPEMAEMLKETA